MDDGERPPAQGDRPDDAAGVPPLPGTIQGRRAGRTTAIATALAVVVAGAATAVVLRAQTGAGPALETRAPADAAVFAKISLRGSDALSDVLARFPIVDGKTIGAQLEEVLQEGFAQMGLDFRRDVRDWLGAEIGAVALSPSETDAPSFGGNPSVVGMLAVRDEGAARASLTRIAQRIPSPRFAFEVADGVAYLAGDAVLIERARSAARDRPLSGDAAFSQARDDAGEPGFALVWSNGQALADLASALTPGPLGILGLGRQQPAAASSLAVIRAIPEGFELVATGPAAPEQPQTPGSPQMLESTSAGLLGSLTVFDPARAFDAFLRQIGPILSGLQGGWTGFAPLAEPPPDPRREVEKIVDDLLGLDLERDLYALAHGELSILVGGVDTEGPLPVQVGVILGVTDEGAADRTMRALRNRLDRALAGSGFDAEPARGGIDIASDEVRLFVRRAAARIVIASNESYGERLLEDVPDELADDLVYRRTFGGLSDSTTFQVYIRVDRLRELLEAFIPGSERSSYERDAAPYLRPIEAIGLRAGVRDGRSLFRVVVTVRE